MPKKPWAGGLTFNPFEGKIKNPEQIKHEEVENKYREVLDGRYDKIRQIIGEKMSFPSEFEGIEKIVLTQPEQGGNSLYATIFYKDEAGRERHVTASIFPMETKPGETEGIFSISDRDVKPIGISRDEIFEQILDHLKKIKLGFWSSSKEKIFQKKDAKAAPTGKSAETEPAKKVLEINEAKLEFFQDHPESLFGFFEEVKGLNEGYHGIVFPHCVVLENPEYGNATYIIPIEIDLDVEKYRSEGISEAEKQKILEKIWKGYSDKSKGDLQQLVRQDEENEEKGLARRGFYRVIHEKDQRFENWVDKLDELLEEIAA